MQCSLLLLGGRDERVLLAIKHDVRYLSTRVAEERARVLESIQEDN